MLKLQAITALDRDTLQDTSYGSITNAEWKQLPSESSFKLHNHRYFELFKVMAGDTVVGLMNLYVHSPHIISFGPEIKPRYQKQGYAYEAEALSLEMVKSLGYSIAIAYVRKANTASMRPHEKLGFEQDQDFVNTHKRDVAIHKGSLRSSLFTAAQIWAIHRATP